MEYKELENTPFIIGLEPVEIKY